PDQSQSRLARDRPGPARGCLDRSAHRRWRICVPTPLDDLDLVEGRVGGIHPPTNLDPGRDPLVELPGVAYVFPVSAVSAEHADYYYSVGSGNAGQLGPRSVWLLPREVARPRCHLQPRARDSSHSYLDDSNSSLRFVRENALGRDVSTTYRTQPL